jgi:hypothetical protein
MSIAVLIAVHDGLVIAADSASTLTVSGPAGFGVANVYDNANKIFNLIKGQPIGCVTFGSGSIGSASIGTLIKDFRRKLTEKAEAQKLGFKVTSYSMDQICRLLSSFLAEECDKVKDSPLRQAINVGLLVGGYSSGASLGESWAVEIKQGLPGDPVKLRDANQVGINWGGEAEVLYRIVLGYSPMLHHALAEVMQPPQPPKHFMDTLDPFLRTRLQAQLVFAPMPIQDAIDLGRFLVHAGAMFSRFSPGAQVVGGPIEIAAITKHEGFKWISRKYYYDKELNPEPIHVIND